MKTLEPLLAKHPFFEGLDPRYLELLVGCASNMHFKPQDIVFKEGEVAQQFFVIREGILRLELFAPGQGEVIIQTIGAGDIAGWSWLFPPYRWHFTGCAATALRVVALDGECLRAKCEQDHSLGYEFLKRFSRIMMDRLQATRLQLLDLYRAH